MAPTDKLRCVQCNVTETPLWRGGPAGPKTLCNACGVRYKKTGKLISPKDRLGKKLTVPLKPKNKKATAVVRAVPANLSDEATTATTSTTTQRQGAAANSTASSKDSPISSSSSSSAAASTSAVIPARDHNPNVRFFTSKILEDYIRPTVTGIIYPTTDASNYQCLLSGLMVVHRSSRRRTTRR